MLLENIKATEDLIAWLLLYVRYIVQKASIFKEYR